MTVRTINRSLPFLLIIPVLLWALLATGISERLLVINISSPPGQLFYIAAKVMGLIGISVAGLQLLVGYTLSPVTQRTHIILGVTLLVCIVAHWLLFSVAVAQRTGAFPFHLLQPWTDGSYYHTGIMLGALAFWLVFLIVLSGLQKTKHYQWAKIIHRFGAAVFGFALIHAWMIGTEATGFWGKVFLGAMASVVVLAYIKHSLRHERKAYQIISQRLTKKIICRSDTDSILLVHGEHK